MVAQPLVSVVVPTYNEESHLHECIESILAQTYEHWECVIVNNCSTDRSGEIARQFAAQDPRIRLHNNGKFLDAVANHNEALRMISAECKYCKVVFADDWIFPDCLQKMVEVAEAHPSIGIVGAYGLQGSRVMWTGLPYPSTLVSGREVCRRLFVDRVYVFGSATSLLYRADVVRGSDPFFNCSNLHADMETCVSLLRFWDFGFVHQVLTFTREEQPGCLRSISERLHTYMAGELRNLVLYGRDILSQRDFDACMRRAMREYYMTLASALVRRGRGKEFWPFHKKTLAELGMPFSRWQLVKTALLRLAMAMAVPRKTVAGVGGTR